MCIRDSATVTTLTTLTLVLPSVTTGSPGPTFTQGQLIFAAVSPLPPYAALVTTPTVRHPDFFPPVAQDRPPLTHRRTGRRTSGATGISPSAAA